VSPGVNERGAHGAPQTPGHSSGIGAYLGVFAALMILTALTVWAAFLHLGVWNTPVALAVAVTKALLVAWIFMHLRDSPRLTIFAVMASVLWLAFLILITVSDYVTRPWLPIYAP
jgi:cytochrome c oxidase subunit IV